MYGVYFSMKALEELREKHLMHVVQTVKQSRCVKKNLCLVVFIILSLLLSGSILVLLVLRDEVVHVGLSLGELHLVHALTGVPVKEGLAAEHGRELLGDALEHLLDRGGVADEGGAILRPLGGMSQTDDLMLFGIHSTKYEEFLFWTLSICSSTSLVDMRPRNMQQQ